MIARTKIDVHAETLSMELGDNLVQFNIFEAIKHPTEDHSLFGIDVIEELVAEHLQLEVGSAEFPNFAKNIDVIGCLGSVTDESDYDKLWEVQDISDSKEDSIDLAHLDLNSEFVGLIDQVCKYDEKLECVESARVQVAKTESDLTNETNAESGLSILSRTKFNLDSENWKLTPTLGAEFDSGNQSRKQQKVETDSTHQELKPVRVGQLKSRPTINISPLHSPPIELKPLPGHLKYAYLDNDQEFPIIIANDLHREQEEKLLQVLKQHKKAIGWRLSNLPGINSSICMHRILIEEEVHPIRQQQRRLNPTILDAVKKKYMQIHIAPEDQHKTTFTCPFGTFVYTRMPFGLCNAPSTFQHYMTSIFSDLLQDCMEVFMDNFIVYTTSFDACLENLSRVLTRSMDTNLVLNFEKCHFMVIEGIVLGHLVSSRGIEVDKSKVAIITSLLNPTSVLEDVDFNFDQPCIEAFQELKSYLTSTPILQAPNWEYPFELMCDTSNSALGAILGQRVEAGKQSYMIAYASRTMDSTQLNYTTTEKELLTIVVALDKFRSYLLGSKIIIFSNHAALRFLWKKLNVMPRLIWWMFFLQEFDIEIRDKKGVENSVADHLSRIERESDPMPI
ncbi:Retrovirus-related Pol polyprotein, partial [Mucuna pruriens]